MFDHFVHMLVPVIRALSNRGCLTARRNFADFYRAAGLLPMGQGQGWKLCFMANRTGRREVQPALTSNETVKILGHRPCLWFLLQALPALSTVQSMTSAHSIITKCMIMERGGGGPTWELSSILILQEATAACQVHPPSMLLLLASLWLTPAKKKTNQKNPPFLLMFKNQAISQILPEYQHSNLWKPGMKCEGTHQCNLNFNLGLGKRHWGLF